MVVNGIKLDTECVYYKGEKFEMGIMIWYDGPKELISFEKELLILWSECLEFFDKVIIINTTKAKLEKYIHGEIGIIDLINSSIRWSFAIIFSETHSDCFIVEEICETGPIPKTNVKFRRIPKEF